jgi:protein gp37
VAETEEEAGLMGITSISWTHTYRADGSLVPGYTFNPWIGCTKVSPACDGCYAEALMDKRYHRVQWGPHGERVRTSISNWRYPAKWQREAAARGDRPFVFCASLADIFDNQVPPEWRKDLLDLMLATPNLVYLVLTKRPQNILKMIKPGELPRNVALGTTIEDQERADINVPHLLKAKVELNPQFAFVSCEPLLSHIDLEAGLWLSRPGPKLDWVITGGETDQGGHKARPSHLAWFRSLRDQCARTGTHFQHKQNGEFMVGERIKDPEFQGGEHVAIDGFGKSSISVCIPLDNKFAAVRVGKNKSGRAIDGAVHHEYPRVEALAA